MTLALSRRMGLLKSSDTRNLLKLTEQGNIISFAGGLPAPEIFPVQKLQLIMIQTLSDHGTQALQYSPTEGYDPLRQAIAKRYNEKYSTALTSDNILITNGAQQGLDLTGKLFLDEGDTVVCESPTYHAAIHAFLSYLPQIKEAPTDFEGIEAKALEEIMHTQKVKFVYTIPDFQNPTGKTWSERRRREILNLSERFHVPIIEDTPYCEIRFEGEDIKSMLSLDKTGMVISLGTFSKILCPGLRIGWIAADEEIIKKFTLIKQNADLHTSIMNQICIYKYMKAYGLDEDIQRTRVLYKKRRDVMIECVKKHFPEGTCSTLPEGGLFLWVTVPQVFNTRELLTESLKIGVAYVPGDVFFPNNPPANTMRLNFSNTPSDGIEEGIKRLGKLLKLKSNG